LKTGVELSDQHEKSNEFQVILGLDEDNATYSDDKT
jgi:hypothetical protein